MIQGFFTQFLVHADMMFKFTQNSSFVTLPADLRLT